MPEPVALERGRGRPRLQEGEDTRAVTIRMTAAQRAKLAALGGADWVRGMIDRATDPGRPTSTHP